MSENKFLTPQQIELEKNILSEEAQRMLNNGSVVSGAFDEPHMVPGDGPKDVRNALEHLPEAPVHTNVFETKTEIGKQSITTEDGESFG